MDGSRWAPTLAPTLNPRAGSFAPQINMITPSLLRRDSMDALNGRGSSSINSLQHEVQQLRTVITQELSGLRYDIDLLQRGGWEVKIGAFQEMLKPNNSSVDALQERILGAKLEQIPLGADNAIEFAAPKSCREPFAATNGTIGDRELAVKIQQVEASKELGKLRVGGERSRPIIIARKRAPFAKIFTSPDEAIQSVEDPSTAARSSYQPLTIRQLSPLMSELASGIPNAAATRTFSVEFIHDLFGGSQWSPGYYYIPPSHGICLLSSRSYYGLNAETDPFLPPAPGTHGAKLIPFVHDSVEEEDPDEVHSKDVPLFVKGSSFAELAGKSRDEFVYFGNYSQLRFSDRLDYDRMVEVIPNDIKMYWAEQLTAPGRPSWMTEKLMEHFYEKPAFSGKLSSANMKDYAEELKTWQHGACQTVDDLTKEVLFQSFASADCDSPPGLRLSWEYLQCTGYDDQLYKFLVKKHDASRSH